MKRILSSRIFLASLFVLSLIVARADEEQDQFAVLHSDASISKKYQACQKLRVIGTVKCVPEVAALLTDPNLSQAARQTLDGLPYPEVDAVLSDALGKTSGLVKAGIVDSIGWRGRPESVALLTPLLSDSDTNISAAAATSLGRLGGKDAVTALTVARDQGAPVQAALLQCAEQLSANDAAGAVAIYRDLNSDKYGLGIRTAAWRGLVMTDSEHRVELMNQALGGTDHGLERVALKTLRDAADKDLVQACAAEWASLSEAAQLALLDAAVKLGNAGPIVRTASQSEIPAIRTAAWTAMGQINDWQSIPALAKASATAKKTERDAARESLAELKGPDAAKALLAELDHADATEKAELLRALGAQHDPASSPVLLQNAAAGDEPVRLAALQSLTEIAPPDALSPLLEILAKADADSVRDAAMEGLSAICESSPDKDAATRAVVEAQEKLPVERQGMYFPLLAQLGTADALTAALASSKSQNVDLAKDAVRALSQWPNAAPANSLLELARNAADSGLQTLALRGAITVSGLEPDSTKRLELLKPALAIAKRPDEKKEALGQLGQIATPETLGIAVKAMDDANVSNEAALAAVNISEKLAGANPDLANDAAGKVLAQHKEGDLFRRAWALRIKSGKEIPFIRNWVMSGPYVKKGVTGAIAIFDVPLGPEVAGQTVEWKPTAERDQVDLAGMFPGQENCVAYLRTTIVAPEECSAVLLMGSDDGIKAWLNGAVVHANNTDRPEKPDDDVAPVALKKGANELVLKITQGGGGWGACARIVGLDGKEIAGLQIQRPTEGSGPLTN